ncbi:phosphatidylglycerophosphatase A [Methanocaldococcus infernus]|uniref:Phosphatidylglycerophosphatase A n=1 Tax=Methanocaldococcus infernus (strain DSM 11812 / JCM 15783 / ME) TaxID=573063 RepID=D5VQB4_METIM|nr:phosphatidylglycerophosphatase A [Methanocaldococcus infernus]ADG12767.1 phosphatidylglycerophosphatase A [Methanocaldococcus infernus ME]
MNILEKINISLDNLVESAVSLYVGEEDIKIVKNKVREVMKKELENPNTYLLIMAAYLLDREIEMEDLNYIYADEVIGLAIANEIAGTKGIFNFRFYDKHKPGVIGELDKKGYIFLDDAIAGFIAGCMSKALAPR